MKKALVLILVAVNLHTDTLIPPKAATIDITIYNNDLAFIHEKREADIKKGIYKLIYEGIPSKIITQSVVPSFSDKSILLFSQSYIYNLISLTSLLDKSIDKNVTFYTNSQKPLRRSGTLLSATPYVIVKDDNDGKIYTLNSPTQVVFEKIPPSMITKPSLIWHIKSQKNTKISVDLKYLSRGISWKSDYVLNMKKKLLDLTGWITIVNNSGAAYKNASINCVAGELHSAPRRQRYDKRYRLEAVALDSAQVKEEPFAGYHLYKIPFKETISQKEQKQILFIDKKDIKYTSYAKALNSHFENYGTQKLVFENIVTFKNDKKNSLGIALPSGTIRMYKKDKNDNIRYIAEDYLPNTPANEKVTLTIGVLFDVTGEKKITKFISNKNRKNVETTYSVRNRSKLPQILKIQERIPVYADKITLKSDCKDICEEKKESAFIREFTISLKPKQQYDFTSEFEVIY